MAYRPELTREEAVQVGILIRRYRNYFDGASPHFDRFEEYYKSFRFYRKHNHPYKYNVSKPFIFTIVMAFVAQIQNAIFQRNRIFDVSPTEGNHFLRPDIPDEKIATQLERALNVLTSNPDFHLFDEVQSLITGLGIYGTAQSQTVPMFDKELNWVGSKTQYLKIFDVIPNPMHYMLQDDVFIREVIDKEELERRGRDEGYFNIDKVSEGTIIPDDIMQNLFGELGLDRVREGGFDKDKGRILLLHYYKNGDVTTIAGNTVIVKDTKKPVTLETPGGNISLRIKPFNYFPMDMVKLYPPPNEFYGIGLAEAAKQYQDNANLRGSQRAENIELGLMKTFLVNHLFDVDAENIVMGAGNIILTNDINNSIKVLETGDITSSSGNEDAIEKFEAQDATGINDILRGNAQRRETATTSVLLEKAGRKKMDVILTAMSFYMKSIGKKNILQMHRFMPQQQYERIIGEPDAGFYRLKEEEIKRFFDIAPSSTALDGAREQEQSNFIQAWQVLAQKPDIINQAELAKFYFEKFFPNIKADRFLANPAFTPGGAAQGTAGVVPPSSQPGPAGQSNFTPEQILQQVGAGQLGG